MIISLVMDKLDVKSEFNIVLINGSRLIYFFIMQRSYPKILR